VSDIVFFEQRLVCHPDMKEIGKFGLPDIRVIVYNLVPVMAMVRIPTRESQGKANIHVGGLGLGVDLSKGEITHIAKYNKIIKEHPDFDNLRGLKIPFWDEILLLATQIQQMITLGYLAVDIVIDADAGPTLLEINARAGLAVQIANLAPLRDRLDRVAGVKVQTAEKGVRMAQDLFGNKIERNIQAISGKKVIGMEESITLNLKHGTKKVVARMNPTMTKNYLEEKLFKKIAKKKDADKMKLGYTLSGERVKTVFYPLEMSEGSYQVILGKKALANFFLDVTRSPDEKKIPSMDTNEKAGHYDAKAPTGDEYLHQVDNQLADIDKKFSLVAQIRPLNLAEEKKKFFASDTYEPQFVYRVTPADLLGLKSALQGYRMDLTHPVGRLLEEKRKELVMKADLIAVIGDDVHFPKLSEHLLGIPPEIVLSAAEKEYKKLKKIKEDIKPISADKVVRRLRSFLKEKRLLNWDVKTKEGIVSRCVVGKNNCLLVKAGEMFSQKDVDKLIAHEIETHVYCTENGKYQPFQLFRRGSAHYLKTQEGLAIYNQNQVIEGGARNAVITFNAVMWARDMGFRDVYDKLRKIMSDDEAWKTTVKVKRGLSDTSNPGAFMKNALYYWGYLEIEEYLNKEGSYDDLFIGKFDLHQLDLIKQLKGLQAPRWLPRSADPDA